MAGRRTSLCYCQSKARQRHIAVSNTIVSCLPQSKHRVYSQNLQALAVAINNQGNCQQSAALPKPSSTCHHLMLQPHLKRPEISSGFIENKNVLYTNQCSCPWFAEQHTSGLSSVHLHQHSGGCHKEPAFALHHPSHIPLQSDTEAAWHLQSLISQKGLTENVRFSGNRWILSNLGANSLAFI